MIIFLVKWFILALPCTFFAISYKFVYIKHGFAIVHFTAFSYRKHHIDASMLYWKCQIKCKSLIVLRRRHIICKKGSLLFCVDIFYTVSVQSMLFGRPKRLLSKYVYILVYVYHIMRAYFNDIICVYKAARSQTQTHTQYINRKHRVCSFQKLIFNAFTNAREWSVHNLLHIRSCTMKNTEPQHFSVDSRCASPPFGSLDFTCLM